ncbi:hypothetical protein [Hymenobacter koreensis]|uniref:Uncharacterized protein n=1 Tax=Hymenobacter koreensis TaxID=1084523 RepID=A0ABP8JK83_9BACT
MPHATASLLALILATALLLLAGLLTMHPVLLTLGTFLALGLIVHLFEFDPKTPAN